MTTFYIDLIRVRLCFYILRGVTGKHRASELVDFSKQRHLIFDDVLNKWTVMLRIQAVVGIISIFMLQILIYP